MRALTSASLFSCLSLVALFSCKKLSDEEGGSPDGYMAPTADDQDGDGIADPHEGQGDEDGDEIPNYLDTDSDADCIPDRLEKGDGAWGTLPIDSDGDGTADFLDLDSDNNGLSDREEVGDCTVPRDDDEDKAPNYRDMDDDADTILDVDESFADFDGDGTPNARDTDSDNDCLQDGSEAGDADTTTLPRDYDSDGSPDFLDTDADNDAILDRDEVAGACTPVGDVDNDTWPDNVDPDIDGDGLDNADEFKLGTDSRVRDSDGDGATDGLEVFAETDPMEIADVPEGTIVTTGPRQTTEAAGKYVIDAYKVDVFLILDTAYSYSCYHPDLPSFVETLVNAVFTRFDDVAVGLGAYDDYNYKTGWAAAGGRPFQLLYQLSTNETAIKAAAESQQMVYGGDSYGSGWEAVYQSTMGKGYDQTCNHAFDTTTDVLPFLSAAGDAFGGTVTGSFQEDIEGTGDDPGVGWRDGSTKVIFLAADNVIRDAELGHEMPIGTCPDPASYSSTLASLLAKKIYFVGVNVYEYQSTDRTLQDQLEDMATDSDSFIDADGDGEKDDPAVLYGSWNWPDINKVVDAIWDLAEETTVDLWFEIGEDEKGWISNLKPSTEQTGLTHGATVDYTFTVTSSAPTMPDDQFYKAEIKVKTDEGDYDIEPIWVVIRPETMI